MILKGTRNRHDKLWDIPIPQDRNNSSPRIIEKSIVQAPKSTRCADPKTINNMGTQVRKISEYKKAIDPTTLVNIFKGEYKAAVIIRRRQPHVDLVKYHHAKYFPQ